MKHQLQQIRTALELATDGPIVDRDGLMREALTALSELERTADAPVAWRHSKTLALYDTAEEVPLADGDEWAEPLFLGAPPAQQPHDHVAVTWDAARTRILAVTLQDAEGRVLCVIDEAPAQQPQYEAPPARADLEAENEKLKDLLGKANALARLRFERVRQLEGRAVNEDYSDCHGPDWTDRESEYLK